MTAANDVRLLAAMIALDSGTTWASCPQSLSQPCAGQRRDHRGAAGGRPVAALILACGKPGVLTSADASVGDMTTLPLADVLVRSALPPLTPLHVPPLEESPGSSVALDRAAAGRPSTEPRGDRGSMATVRRSRPDRLDASVPDLARAAAAWPPPPQASASWPQHTGTAGHPAGSVTPPPAGPPQHGARRPWRLVASSSASVPRSPASCWLSCSRPVTPSRSHRERSCRPISTRPSTEIRRSPGT
jgi:hypothetical protein